MTNLYHFTSLLVLIGVLPAFQALNSQTPKDLASNFRQIYRTLETPAPLAVEKGNFRFNYVCPPIDGKFMVDTAEIPPEYTPGRHQPNNIALYLPGLDGYGISATNQFNDLASTFQFWRLTIAPDDRSSLAEYVKNVADFCKERVDQGGKVTLIGESCGGLVAAAVAQRLQTLSPKVLKGLVLVNPATSFERSAWELLVPLLTNLQASQGDTVDEVTPYSIVGSLILSALIPDNDQKRRIFDLIRDAAGMTSWTTLSMAQLQELTDASVDAFKATEERLPPGLLGHRVSKWLSVGSLMMSEARLRGIQTPTLVVAGEADAFLPSKEEAHRLERLLPSCEKLVVEKRGHFVLDENVNLTEAILYSKIDPLARKASKKPYNIINDWRRPSKERLDETIENTVKPLRDFHSPVWFTTDATGKRWKGLSKFPVPKAGGGPLLIVANHQFAALDLRLIIAELLERFDIFVRGLAHPIAFAGSQFDELRGRTPGVRPANSSTSFARFGDFQEFGAVPVNPKNYYKMLASGQDVLLFPGGAKEALTGNKSYPLYWPDKADFVRTAAKFNATIVPLAAIGMVDSVNVIAEPEDLLKAPIIGDRLKELTRNVTAARYDMKSEEETVIPTPAVPSTPARNYFLFGRPIRTDNLNHRDKETCEIVYRQARTELRQGLDDLLAAREHDSFGTPEPATLIKRLTYERVFQKQAPTFPISELNRR